MAMTQNDPKHASERCNDRQSEIIGGGQGQYSSLRCIVRDGLFLFSRSSLVARKLSLRSEMKQD